MAFRLVATEIPDAAILGIPESVIKLYQRQRGLILVTGPTGSGKSTTLASIIDMINNNPHPQRADVVNLLQKLWSEIVAREAWLTEYVIYSPNEFATSNEKGFWNQDKFWWDTIDNATSFEEVPAVLPPALGNDARAVLKRQAAEHIG